MQCSSMLALAAARVDVVSAVLPCIVHMDTIFFSNEVYRNDLFL